MKGTVLFTKKNTLGIYGFIKAEKGDSFYFDTSCIVKGNYIQKGSTVSFDIEQMANGKTKAINVANFEYKKLDAEQRDKIEQLLSDKLNEVSIIDFASIPAILKTIGFDYKEYSEDLGSFIQKEFAGVFIARKKVEINGKVYQVALARYEAKDLLPHDKEEEISERLSMEMTKNGFIQYSTLPKILSELGVNYQLYASSITQFVEMYLTKHFVAMRNVPMNGKVLPSILVPFGSELLSAVTPTPAVQEKSVGADFEKLEKYIEDGRYEEFLRSEKFSTKTPNQLGVNGILLAIKAIAGFLGDDPNIKLNDFQRVLIETERASDLTQFRDDEEILRLGLQSSYVPMTMDTFKICFADVYHGKNNLNNNWNALVERFWCVKNDIAFYFNAIWLVILKKDRCVDFYIEEGAKQKNLHRIADLVRIWKHFSDSSHFTIPLRLKRKLIGNCLDCGNIESLCNAIRLFDDFTMPEAKQLALYLQGDSEIDSDTLMSYFHSDVEALVSEKLVNLFWYRYKDREHLPKMIVRVLSSVCWDYDESYIEVILYNNTYNDFSVSQKTKILLGAFEQLCEYTKTYRKAYLLVNYIYTHIVPNYSHVLGNPCVSYSERWDNLKAWMIEQVTAQLSSDARTARLISVFKYDDVAMHELEMMYCNDYVKPELDGCFDEESLDDLVDQYRIEGIPFVSQWIDSQYRKSAEHGVDTLIQEQRFSEAIRWVQTQNTLGVAKKKTTLRKIICENFKARGFNENAYDIFAHAIPVAFAETILLEGLTANEDDAIAALFAIYVFQKNWLKIAYMYAPYSATRNTMHPKLYEQVKNILIDNGIDANKYAVSHFDVIKTAIRVLSNNEFDEFIEWAKKIQIPYGSKLYELKPKTFDAVIKNMLVGADYSGFWDQLIMQVLRTDNAEQQDMLRYSIITSYIGRFGAAKFERMISALLKWKGPGKDYYGYYTSIWKGLFTGKYGCNLLFLNVPLINEAPITYWNLFYDIAVCKNHVFSLDGLWGTQWHSPNYNIQEFYSALIERYTESRETVFLQIAIKLLEQCNETVVTEFDKYLSYCNSNKSKDFLFQGIIGILDKKKYFNEIGTFLKSGYWYNTENERKLSLVLELICDNDHEKLNEVLRLNLDEYWYEQFVSDFLTAFSDYPKVDVLGVLQNKTRPEEYRFLFVKNAFQIVYVQSQLVSMQNNGLIVAPKYTIQNEGVVRSYLGMMDVCYRRQLQTNTAPNAVWVQNRYHRILAACILLSDSIGDYDDEDIVALMQNNKHFSDAYNNYKGFREAMKRIIKSETMNDRQKQIVLLSVVSNEWEDFINHIAEYEHNDLENIHSMMELSNYRELNMQLLERYLITLHGNYTDVDVSRINAYSPKLGYVLSELKATQRADIDKYNLLVGLLIGICRLKQQSRPSVSYDKLDYSMAKNQGIIESNWDLFSAALWATSYETTIMFMFGDDIRNVRKRCTFPKIKLWEKVFRSISQMSVYHYLVSVWYAIDRKREEAKAAYNKIITKNDIPSQWNQERKELEAYLEGRSDRFFANSNKNISTLSAETEAQNLDYIAVAVGSNVVSSEDAVAAYRAIQNNPNKITQLSAYKKLFGFVRKPDDLYEIYRQIDTKKEKLARETYNELVIAFGSLLVVADDEFIHDEKFTILSSMMEVFELLSDINKEKSSVREQLKEAESFVLGTPGLSMETWLNCFERIKAIMSHYAISNPVGLITELCIPVEQCIEGIGKCETKMQILEWLAKWRNNWNVSSNCSDYERAFVNSVDDELYRLRHGINLHLDVLNEDNLIEDGSIFYQIENIAGKSNLSVTLNNQSGNDSAQLEVKIGINGEIPVVFDNAVFSSIVELRPGDICGQVYKLHKEDKNMYMNNGCGNKKVDVFMDKSVVQKINSLIHRDPFHECGGIFIGNVSVDQVTGKHTVHIHDLYFEERLGTGSTFEFTTDYLMNAVKYVKKNCPEYHIVGNIHSHAQFQAFWSGQDKEMMSQSRDNSFYMVVSPKYGTWEAVFKDIDFNYYHCDVKIADDTCCEYMFGKSVEADEMRSFRNGRPYQTVTYRVNRSYTDVQRRELDKRFLHSITELSGKKVLIVGAGTVGNLLAEYAMNSGISNLCIVDMDAYHYWNLPRSSMIREHAQEKPKALELAKAIAERSYFPIQVTGINADICELGWGFFKDFDLVLSPVDSASIRQYVDRGCKLYRIPHITCGTGIIDGDFTGNVVAFPSHAVVDLEYVWGTGYRANLEERRSCSDIAEETQAQVMGFSAQIAGITMDLALKYLLGKIEDKHTVWKYILNAVGNGFARDKAALRTFKYGKLPTTAKSELYEVFNPSTEFVTVRFDRSMPKHLLWEQLNELFGEDIFSYGLNLEWSLNIPVAYRSTNAYAKIEVSKDSGVDEVLYELPDCHVYLVEGDEKDYLIELQFVDCSNKEA